MILKIIIQKFKIIIQKELLAIIHMEVDNVWIDGVL